MFSSMMLPPRFLFASDAALLDVLLGIDIDGRQQEKTLTRYYAFRYTSIDDIG